MATDKTKRPRIARVDTERLDPEQKTGSQVGQAFPDLGKLTRRLPRRRTRSRSRSTSISAPSRERLVTLIEALGDSQHPDHPNALDELVKIGPPAIPFLSDMINPQRPWLLAYRATEALGRIGDGRATGTLTQALRHPNSNVRWSAVHALAQIADLRAMMELRRVAAADQGKTSWGESVAESAQNALDQMRSQSLWNQSMELVKTAVTSVLMILSLVVTFSIVTTLRSELDIIRSASITQPSDLQANVRTPLPTSTPESEAEGAALLVPTVIPSTPTREPTEDIPGTVLQSANVRPAPNVNNQPIGSLRQNDEVILLARSADGQWYRIRLGTRVNDSSYINNPDGSNTGWINQALLTPPEADLPVEELSSDDESPSP